MSSSFLFLQVLSLSVLAFWAVSCVAEPPQILEAKCISHKLVLIPPGRCASSEVKHVHFVTLQLSFDQPLHLTRANQAVPVSGALFHPAKHRERRWSVGLPKASVSCCFVSPPGECTSPPVDFSLELANLSELESSSEHAELRKAVVHLVERDHFPHSAQGAGSNLNFYHLEQGASFIGWDQPLVCSTSLTEADLRLTNQSGDAVIVKREPVQCRPHAYPSHYVFSDSCPVSPDGALLTESSQVLPLSLLPPHHHASLYSEHFYRPFAVQMHRTGASTPTEDGGVTTFIQMELGAQGKMSEKNDPPLTAANAESLNAPFNAGNTAVNPPLTDTQKKDIGEERLAEVNQAEEDKKAQEAEDQKLQPGGYQPTPELPEAEETEGKEDGESGEGEGAGGDAEAGAEAEESTKESMTTVAGEEDMNEEIEKNFKPPWWDLCDMTDPFGNPFCPLPAPPFIFFNILIKCMIQGMIGPLIDSISERFMAGQAAPLEVVENIQLELSNEELPPATPNNSTGPQDHADDPMVQMREVADGKLLGGLRKLHKVLRGTLENRGAGLEAPILSEIHRRVDFHVRGSDLLPLPLLGKLLRKNGTASLAFETGSVDASSFLSLVHSQISGLLEEYGLGKSHVTRSRTRGHTETERSNSTRTPPMRSSLFASEGRLEDDPVIVSALELEEVQDGTPRDPPPGQTRSHQMTQVPPPPAGKILIPFITKYLYEGLVNPLTVAMAQNATKEITKHCVPPLHEKLVDSLKEHLEFNLVHSYTHIMVNTIPLTVGETVPELMTRTIPLKAFLGVTSKGIHSVTRAVTHSLSSTLIHSLNQWPEQNYFCYLCAYHQQHCHKCQILTQSYDTRYALYYNYYHSSLYGDYFSDMYASSIANVMK